MKKENSIIKNKFPKFEDFNNLYEQEDWGRIESKILNDCKKRTRFIACLYTNDQLIGMGRIMGDGLHFGIYDVIVKKEFQGKGYGALILENLLSWFDSLPIKPNLTLGSTYGNEGFYEKFGFKRRPNDNIGAGMKYYGRNK